MDKRHPVADLLNSKSLHSRYMVDSLSMRHARIAPDEYIHKDLVRGIVEYFMQNANIDDVITKREDEGYNTIYEAELFVMTPKDMFQLLDEAFKRGADFQYKEMYRVLSVQLDKAEEKLNDSKTDSE